jgi:glycosyltransferase involved in cell wall biosynthesis
MFRAWFRSRDIELVFAVTTVLPSAVLAARLEQIPVLLYAAEIPPRERRPGEKRLAALSKRLVMEGLIRVESRIARKVIVCSPGVTDLVSDRARATVHYPPIDEAECIGDADSFRSDNGIAPNAPLIVCIGSISRGRGQDVLISVIPSLLDEFPDLRVLINGAPFPREQDLSYSAELDRQIQQLGLGEVVIRRERTDPLGPLLCAADVAVNPATTYNEGFGRVAFEAGLAATPMVASARGVLPELHEDGETIMLVPPSDPEALGAAISELLRDEEKSEAIAAGAARLARELASPAASLEVFKRVISSAESNPVGRD